MGKVKINTKLRIWLDDLKTEFKRNKVIYITMLICFLIAFVRSILDVSLRVSAYSNRCIYTQIQSGDFHWFLFYLKIILPTLLMFGIAFLLSLNFYLFLLSFAVVYIYIRYYLIYFFCCNVISGLCGYICFLLCWLPLLLVNLLLFCNFFIKMVNLIMHCPKSKHITPYSCMWYRTKTVLFRTLAVSFAITFIMTTLVIIILNIIY